MNAYRPSTIFSVSRLTVFLLFLVAASACEQDRPEVTVKSQPAQTVKEQPSEKKQFSPTTDDVIGQWRNVATNPSRRNTVTNRYMRHTFFGDGTVVVENKEDSQNNGTWEFVDGMIVVSSSYETSLFTETYEFSGRDKLLKTRFQSIVGGKPMADYDPDESFIRQGSDREKRMKVWDVFSEVSDMMDFVDPNSLDVGKVYILSKNTPLMSSFEPVGSSAESVISQIQESQVIQKGGEILIRERREVEYQIWYNVQAGEHTGWIKSTALFGQDLKQR